MNGLNHRESESNESTIGRMATPFERAWRQLVLEEQIAQLEVRLERSNEYIAEIDRKTVEVIENIVITAMESCDECRTIIMPGDNCECAAD